MKLTKDFFPILNHLNDRLLISDFDITIVEFPLFNLSLDKKLVI